jgi:hypothetical protein
LLIWFLVVLGTGFFGFGDGDRNQRCSILVYGIGCEGGGRSMVFGISGEDGDPLYFPYKSEFSHVLAMLYTVSF